VNDSVGEWPQLRLAALLRYFQRGDFQTFGRACELAFGQELAASEYFSASVLLAAQVCGLCEISTVSGAVQWWIAHSGDIRVRSEKAPKEIGMTPEWFEKNRHRVMPLVTDSSGRALLLGVQGHSGGEACGLGLFSTPFDRLVAPFKEAERNLLVDLPFLDNLEGTVEAFSPERGAWKPATGEITKEPQLLRVRGVYSGVSYIVQHPDLGIRFKVLQPEWAFVAAYFLLPWQTSSILHVDRDTVRIRRPVRLPTLMYRSLFAGSESLCIGPTVAFERVDSESIRGVVKYLEQAGERA